MCRGAELLDGVVWVVALETRSGVNTGRMFMGLASSACSSVLVEAHGGMEVSDILDNVGINALSAMTNPE
jgi:hypothetical protein